MLPDLYAEERLATQKGRLDNMCIAACVGEALLNLATAVKIREGVRPSLAQKEAALELLQKYPLHEMDSSTKLSLLADISETAIRLGRELSET